MGKRAQLEAGAAPPGAGQDTVRVRPGRKKGRGRLYRRVARGSLPRRLVPKRAGCGGIAEPGGDEGREENHEMGYLSMI